MPSFKDVYAVLPVSDHAAAVAWYERWLGRRPDTEPMEGVAEWQITGNAGLQVTHDPETAGKSTLVLVVEDIDETVGDLTGRGVECGPIQDFGFVKLTEIVDPAGNKVTFVWENPSPE
ncbi:VOC family protein [Amycolatopsis sp. TNS106]|uniref:VOC family protein n=1 Tax=Amycolatopsis sp. TNS106 TaxID=2861750 RepID=UPI001C573B21|nr:VOC family protein [Amycolatopsis sp. TNS106]QXV57548.1 bleomycin resistance protein [Amycolatopsis sp. TNS106]